MAAKDQVAPSEWAPLHIAVFRAIWFASLAANVGTWFQNVGGVWLMTRFTTSPILIALMQTATTLPVFLVGFLAGALADIVNSRRLLLATQGLIMLTAAALSVLTFAGLMNPPLLLGWARSWRILPGRRSILNSFPSKYCLTISTFVSILSRTDTKNDHLIAHGIGYGLSRECAVLSCGVAAWQCCAFHQRANVKTKPLIVFSR